MKNNIFITIGFALIFSCISLLSAVSCKMNTDSDDQFSDRKAVQVENDSFTVDDPLSYKNLEIFPVTGNMPEGGRKYRPLSEAIGREDVVLEETGDVNLLSISNNSDDYIFILAGDIVKGGRQDRTIENDMIIPPHTRKLPVESYCVESGRWQKRGVEAVNKFSDNSKVLSSRDLKLASRYAKDQSAVWQKVAEKQDKLNENLAEMKGEEVNVRSEASETSLQLTLESKELEDMTNEFKANLAGFSEHSIGFAYAINGQLYGIDIYRNSALFDSLKTKLLDAVIAEAISEYEKGIPATPLKKEVVLNRIKAMSNDSTKESQVNDHTLRRMSEDSNGVFFETIDPAQGKQWVRKNYIVKP